MKKFMQGFAWILAGALWLVPPAQVGFNKGKAAYNRGDYTTALKEFRPLANAGDAKAQCNLGLMYRNGQGVPQNFAEAAKWFSLAAKKGLAKAQLGLGLMYYEGKGVPKNNVFAYALANLATAKNNDFADFREIIAKEMSPSELAQAQALSLELAKPGNFDR